jgi:hypothetical protein
MLSPISRRVVLFYERAADCHEKSGKAETPDGRDFFLEMEQRWLALARHREETERLIQLTAEKARRRKLAK